MEGEMRSLIVYYSRTGNTARVARALAQTLDADICEIRCDRYQGGRWRYLLAGYDSVMGYLPAIEMPEFALKDYDLLVIGTPIWTSHPSPPVRAFAAQEPVLPARVGVFVTFGGHSPAKKAIDELDALLGIRSEASLALAEDQLEGDRFNWAVGEFAERLKSCEVLSMHD